MSSDGSTIVVGGSGASLQPYHLGWAETWRPLGKKLTVAVGNDVRATVTSDGNQVAIVEFVYTSGSSEATTQLKMMRTEGGRNMHQSTQGR